MMLKKLFGVRPSPLVQPAAPAGARVYVIGDIHGRFDLLRRLRAQIVEDAEGAAVARKVLVYLGDYVDRGDASKQVVELLIDEPLAGFESVFLSGNHEAMMLGFLDDPALGAMWLHNGGDATLFSYGVGIGSGANAEQRMISMQAGLRTRLPDSHLAFLRGLCPYHVEGDYLFVHAGIQPGVPIADQTDQELYWIREAFLYSKADHGYCVVHGHTIVSEPEFRQNRIGIDTGAFFTNTLTCLVLEGTDQRILHT
jgi:serine/threonine protein phosphatase 1